MMASKKIDLSIIIVNYNGLQYLDDCVSSIELKCIGLSYEVIFVDNKSTDSSVAFICSHYSWVKVITSDTNLGFSKGNNLGVASSSGENLLLLNSDTVLLTELRVFMDIIRSEDIGVVGAKMFGPNNEPRRSFGRFPSALMMLKLSRMYFDTRGSDKGILDVDWVEGSFLLTRRSVWELVGGLDPEYFMYVEDVDYCKKVSIHGYRRICNLDSGYIHYGGYGETRQGWLKDGFRIYANNFSRGYTLTIFNFFITVGFGLRNAKRYLRKFT
jgi:hypothetical protein